MTNQLYFDHYASVLVYCCSGEGPNQPLTGMWRMLWPVMECSVNRPADGEPIGAIFVEV